LRKWLAGILCAVILACVFIPQISFTESSGDREDVELLARVIYALGKNESFETKLALGTVVMNRVSDPWFDNDLGDVLREQQQFPAGQRYDEESMDAARAVVSGRRVLKGDALYYQAADASHPWQDTYLVDSVGNYNFYSAAGC